MYTNPNYAGGPGLFTENNFYCRSGGSAIGSVRNVGHPTDISISTIALFESPVLSGNMSQYTSNVPNYDGTFCSFSLTPPGIATFDTQTN